jgi:two-component system chemotaxis sensor kinase CheA
MSELQEAAKEFLVETYENLEQLDSDLVSLEKNPPPREALSRIFRTLHTIKGSCSFLGFPHLEKLAHAGEDLLGKLRDGEVALRPDLTDGLLRMVDAIRRILTSIEQEGHEGEEDESELIELLKQLSRTDGVPPSMRTLDMRMTGVLENASSDFVFSEEAIATEEMADSVATTDGSSLIDASITTEGSAVYDASVRISVDLLDKLMTVAGEIVLARNQILQYSQQHGDPSFQNTCRQLNLITTELQEHVMKTRLQPLGNVWSRFSRLVRDTANACGKKVRLETEGSETELDKTLIEAIRDPLTHLVRNAIDHGIESPAQRLAAGKPEEGCVLLHAYHEGGRSTSRSVTTAAVLIRNESSSAPSSSAWSPANKPLG